MKTMLLTGLILITLSCIPREDPPQRNPELLTEKVLPSVLDENSGMTSFGDLIWFINDSGNDSAMYGYSTQDNEVKRTVHIHSAHNTDWEDITQNNQYVFIGDFGNNAAGNRTDLRIYIIRKDDVIANDTVEPEGVINFSYEDQSDFSAQGNNNTNFDCEGFIATESTIVLFSKDWIDNKTRLYTLSIAPGLQTAMLKKEWNVGALVTSACYSGSAGDLYLAGYTESLTPVIWQFTGFNTETLNFDHVSRTDFDMLFTQTEGIMILNGQIYVSSEAFTLIQPGTPASLFRLDRGN
ncbi:MAG TPA: hypothetical protein VK179_00385 [Bacteroidales bacterium]|nr:hypothetical protein [Bacteroidales bacterium]